MSHNNTRNKPEEPNTAPQPDRWYNLNLGSSFQDNNNNSSTKFYSLRYEFKPASIDKSQTGSLHKSKENRVTVEFQNNQIGKPKLSFDGSSEDYKDNDAVLFFDGERFRLERLHRAVKRLRHNRPHGEVGMGSGSGSGGALGGMDARSPPQASGRESRGIKAVVNAVPVEMERIDIGEPRSPVLKQPGKGVTETKPAPAPIASADSMDSKSNEIDEHLSMLFDDVESAETPTNKVDVTEQEEAVNATNHNDLDDEIAVDLSDDETGNGPNAAEALRGQGNAKGSEGSSSSSSSSGSSGSGSGSGSSSSSSDSEASDDNSVNSI
ncbi:hypothetical protein ACHQM5_005678 [Ranunculus cassubicifolius]